MENKQKMIQPICVDQDEIEKLLKQSQIELEQQGIDFSKNKKQLVYEEEEKNDNQKQKQQYGFEGAQIQVINFNKYYELDQYKTRELINSFKNQENYLKNGFFYLLQEKQYYQIQILDQEQQKKKRKKLIKICEEQFLDQIVHQFFQDNLKYQLESQMNLFQNKKNVSLKIFDCTSQYEEKENITDKYYVDKDNNRTEDKSQQVKKQTDHYLQILKYIIIPYNSIKDILDQYAKKIVKYRLNRDQNIKSNIYWGQGKTIKIQEDDQFVDEKGQCQITKIKSEQKLSNNFIKFKKQLLYHQQLLLDQIIQDFYGSKSNEKKCQTYFQQIFKETLQNKESLQDKDEQNQNNKFNLISSQNLDYELISQLKLKLKEHDRIIIEMKTGTGKTITALKLISILGLKTLIVVNKEDLKKQWQMQILDSLELKQHEQLEDDVFQGKGNIEQICNDIYIGVINSVSMNMNYLENFDLIIIDEFHRIGAESFLDILKYTTETRFVVGLSATPERNDRREQIYYNFFNRKYICKLNLVENIRFSFFGFADFQCKNNTFYRQNLDNAKVKLKKLQYCGQLLHTESRNKFILQILSNILKQQHKLDNNININQQIQNEELLKQTRRKILIFCRNINHIELLKDMLIEQYGQDNIGCIYGSVNNYKGQKIIIGTYNKCAEGLDVKGLNTLILAQPPNSQDKSLTQLCGRIGRIDDSNDNKQKIIPQVVEIVDNLFLYNIESRIKNYQIIYQGTEKFFDFNIKLLGEKNEINEMKKRNNYIGNKTGQIKINNCTQQQFYEFLSIRPQ